MSTLKQIMKTPEKGGLTSNVCLCFPHSMIVRYWKFMISSRTSFIGTTPPRLMMVLEAKKAHSAYAPSGSFLFYSHTVWEVIIIFYHQGVSRR